MRETPVPSEALLLPGIFAPETTPLPPLLKWVGSKRRLAPHIGALIRANLGPEGRLIEPFFGGGSVFFWLRPARALLSDALPELIDAYRAIVSSPKQVAKHVKKLAELPCTKETYLEIRSIFNANRLKRSRDTQQAARFLYLNRRGYNGLWRQNLRSECNVPWGGERTNPLPVLEDIEQASLALAGANLYAKDFSYVISQSRAGDVIYADPPYAGTYDGYAGSFTVADQQRLAKTLGAAHKRGVIILLSNSDHPSVLEHFSSFLHPTHVEQYHCVGAKGESRRKVQELLLSNIPSAPEALHLDQASFESSQCLEIVASYETTEEVAS